MAIIQVAIISVNYSEESFLKELFIMDILKYGSEKYIDKFVTTVYDFYLYETDNYNT